MEFLTYRKFYEQEEVQILTQALEKNGIEFEVIEDRENMEIYYGANPLSKQFFVKIRKENFAKVDSILATESEKELASVDKDHYLHSFTDEELFEILSKPDEWSILDYQLSHKLLNERGKDINDETLELLKKQRINELAKPEEGHKTWIYAGYLFALLGGIIGVFIGWHLTTNKKTLPDGRIVYGYKAEDRKQGRIIWIIGTIMFIVTLIAKSQE